MFTPTIWLMIAKIALIILISRCIIVWSYRIFLHPLHSYPGPFAAKFTDFYGAYHAWNRNLHWTTYYDHRKYGQVIRHGPNKLVFNSATALHDIYKNDAILKSRAYLVTQIAPTIFNLFNVIDRSAHRVKRRIIGQGVNERAMRQFEPVMAEQIKIFLKQLIQSKSENASVDMTEACNHLGLDISVELGFGYNLHFQTENENRWMAKGISTSNWRINVYMQFPALKSLNLEKILLPFVLPKVMRYHRLVTRMITSRRSESVNARPDLFSFVSGYKDPETGTTLSPRELWSESTFLIPAGGDTTSTAMTAVFFYLAKYPQCYEKLAKEIRSEFSSGSEICGGPKLSGCKYLRACIDETLRITPPVGATLWREVPSDTKVGTVIIDGHVIPPGTQVGVNIHTLHHNEAYFPDPFVFIPERWLKEADTMDTMARQLMHDAFTPFSLGARGCAGKAMAYLETSLVIAKTIWCFDFTFANEQNGIGNESRIFQVKDQVGSAHTGPNLMFEPRGEFWNELV